jgi:hypothetical protein
MTEQDISKIERELAVTLPADYKAAVQNYPVRADYGTDDSVLFDDAEAVIDQNRRYRAGFAGLPPWPSHYFFIGDDGAASCYLLDLSKSPAPVLFADHGNIDDIRTEATAVEDWVTRYLADLRADGVDPDAAARPANWFMKLFQR